jgi:hypothetical protein
LYYQENRHRLDPEIETHRRRLVHMTGQSLDLAPSQPREVTDVDAEDDMVVPPTASGKSLSNKLESFHSPSESVVPGVRLKGHPSGAPFTEAENHLMVRHIVSWGSYNKTMWNNLAVSFRLVTEH